jgi:hypothetical protein
MQYVSQYATQQHPINQPHEETMSIYKENGYESRRDYLDSLADDFGIDKQTVYSLASLLGSNEDFDGLVTALEDIGD